MLLPFLVDVGSVTNGPALHFELRSKIRSCGHRPIDFKLFSDPAVRNVLNLCAGCELSTYLPDNRPERSNRMHANVFERIGACAVGVITVVPSLSPKSLENQSVWSFARTMQNQSKMPEGAQFATSYRMHSRRFRTCSRWIFVLTWIVVVSTISSRAWADESRPHLLLIVADDLRADVMSVYGGPVPTPHLQRLADRGVQFRRATCGYPICHISRSEILTGRCLVKEAFSGASIPFARDWLLWPQQMAHAGWNTVHFGKWHVAGTPEQCGYRESSANFVANSETKFPLTLSKSATGRSVTGYVGWVFKAEDGAIKPEWGVGLTPQTDERIAEMAVQRIQRADEQPQFLHVNFTAPHDPLHWPDGKESHDDVAEVQLPPNFRSQHPFDHGNLYGRDERIIPAPRSELDVQRERAVYHAVVSNLDRQIGKILNAVEGSRNPERWLIVFTSDQGLAIGSHGLMGKQNQYEHTINSPLLIAGPRVSLRGVVNEQCALRDLYPTVCELMEVSIPATVDGTSLFPVLNQQSPARKRTIFGYYNRTQRMIRTDDGWKLVWYPLAHRFQLFYLPDDPSELNDLSSAQAASLQFREMKSELKRWLNDMNDPTTERNQLD